MFKNRIFFISMLTLSFVGAKADSVQSIDVLNNSAQVFNLAANNADNSFTVGLRIPAYAKAFVISQITELSVLEDKLFAGIFRNSSEEVKQAIAAGANVNKLREGKTPLAWALSFNMVNAAACLLQHGAR
jgi:hypothetical protein